MSCPKDKHIYIAPSVLDVVLMDTVLPKIMLSKGNESENEGGGGGGSGGDPFSDNGRIPN